VAAKTRPVGRRQPHMPVQVRCRLAGGQVGHRSVDRLVDAVGRGGGAAFGVLYRARFPRFAVWQATVDDACAQPQHAELVALLAPAPGRRLTRAR
jgi:hypothetical protein